MTALSFWENVAMDLLIKTAGFGTISGQPLNAKSWKEFVFCFFSGVGSDIYAAAFGKIEPKFLIVEMLLPKHWSLF